MSASGASKEVPLAVLPTPRNLIESEEWDVAGPESTTTKMAEM